MSSEQALDTEARRLATLVLQLYENHLQHYPDRIQTDRKSVPAMVTEAIKPKGLATCVQVVLNGEPFLVELMSYLGTDGETSDEGYILVLHLDKEVLKASIQSKLAASLETMFIEMSRYEAKEILAFQPGSWTKSIIKLRDAILKLGTDKYLNSDEWPDSGSGTGQKDGPN